MTVMTTSDRKTRRGNITLTSRKDLEQTGKDVAPGGRRTVQTPIVFRSNQFTFKTSERILYYPTGAIRSKESILFLSSLIADNSRSV